MHAGEVLGLLGPNGAGKTTAIKVLTSLCERDRGVFHWRGQPVRSKLYLRDVGVLLEGRGALNERLSTWENAKYFCGLREARFDAGHFNQLTELLELPDVRAPVRLLSTGNKLKSALLLCLIHKPAVLLLDEPTIGLDVFGVANLPVDGASSQEAWRHRALVKATRRIGLGWQLNGNRTLHSRSKHKGSF